MDFFDLYRQQRQLARDWPSGITRQWRHPVHEPVKSVETRLNGAVRIVAPLQPRWFYQNLPSGESRPADLV
jgi:hypothetical protein